MTRHRFIAAFLGVVSLGVAACAVHEPHGIYRRSLAIGDRGISVPLPPPSLFAAPMQPVDVDAEVRGGAKVEERGVVAVLLEQRSGEEVEVEVSPGSTDISVRLPAIDLTDNCIELWLETSDGMEGEHHFFTARIEDEQSVVVDEGC